MEKLAIPSVHLNGTSKADLLEQLENAYRALKKAEKAMCEAAPHPRDYYVQSEDAYNTAVDQHQARLKKIGSILKEYEIIAPKIYFEEV